MTKKYCIALGLATICLMSFLTSCLHDTALAPSIPSTVVDIDTSGSGGGTGGGETGANPCDPDSVYFETDVLPIFISNCAKSGCHDAASHEKGIVLTSYEQVMNTADIKPFDLEHGKLYEAITDSDPDDRMPPPPNTPLSGDQVAIIAKWIQQGALNITCNANSGGCDTSNVTYTSTVAPILQTNCVGCHNNNLASGGIQLNQYNGVAAVALSGQLIGAITHAPGFTAMPLGGNQLPDCEILQISQWVNDGATDN